VFDENFYNMKVWGKQGSAQTDQKLLEELQKRVNEDKSFQLPDGYQKVLEKDIIIKHKLPSYLVEKGLISESQKIVTELLDDLFSEKFNVHILEPMSETVS